jgi:alkylated DNA nucleotide flippase Atl1
MTAFSERVVRIARSIPPGRVTTYRRIARAAGGGALSAQSVTAVLGRAWEKGERDIPWHRIVYADGRIWIDRAHRKERLALYEAEGIRISSKNRIEGFADILYEFR